MEAIDFARKVREQHDALEVYARYLTRDREEAGDLLQETYLRAFTHYRKFTDNTNLKGWLYTIMRNVFINQYRRMVKQNTFLDKTDNYFYLDSVAASRSNEGEMSLTLQDIQHAMDTLPYDFREAFLMSYRGFRYQEIADFFGIPIGTVKTRIHLARQLLKKQLKTYGEHYGLHAA